MLKVRKFSGTRSSDKLTCRSRRIFHASLRRLTDCADMQADKSLLDDMTDLERDDSSSNRHRALSFCLSMIFFGKPVSTFPDHALMAEFATRAKKTAKDAHAS